jgi:hypothetical protein
MSIAGILPARNRRLLTTKPEPMRSRILIYCKIKEQVYECQKEQLVKLLDACVESKSPFFAIEPLKWGMATTTQESIGQVKVYNLSELSSSQAGILKAELAAS